MKLFLLGFSHKTTPIEVRESLDFSKKDPKDYLEKLKEIDGISSAAIVSTCNRVEIYATTSSEKSVQKKLEAYLESFHGKTSAEVEHFFYVKSGEEAVRHLFRVASSLDSLVVGEPQILGQVKDAYFESVQQRYSDAFLEKIFQKTFSVAKKVRTETKISEQAVSISFMAVELAKKIFGDLSKTSIMIVGAGEMAELCAKHLVTFSPKGLYFVNRTYEHSVRLSQEFKGIPIEWGKYKDYLSLADIIITSTGASQHLIHQADVSAALEKRKQEPMFLVDISVPRNVSPDVNELENVYLYNIDDLQGMIDENVMHRKEEAQKAEMIVDSEVVKFFQSLEKLKMAPMVQALQEKYQFILEKELARLEKKLPRLGEKEKAEIQKAFASMQKKMLNDPILYATRTLASQDLDDLETFNRIFGLSNARVGDQEGNQDVE